ncbi:ribonuclease K6 [Castor canadensis]|uniref:Ribonuclease K6 n=1 Tax=Castor canadensis TaxID=51338 RepID=A0A250YAG5_CASCN|nr:ribonuclease K6 [Castor canadensis]XP_020033173.1 ribonuclease K6 [Castor canadensis]XP_020033174.1 ribonuclease K6 [Castor canadensis]
MAFGLLGCFPLLLLVGLWTLVCPRCAQPKHLTKAHWFEIQHIQLSPQQCNMAMSGVNNYTQHCKPENTFLHNSFQNVAAACDLPNITCKNGENNCHLSAQPVNMTQCRLRVGKYPDCLYSHAVQDKFFIIACAPPQKSDPPYHLVPIHLDKIV